MSGPRRIVVTGNCQVASIANLLRVAAPSATVTPHHVGVSSPTADELAAADLWIRMPQSPTTFDDADPGTPPTALIWPTVVFSAFHPDVAYIMDESGRVVPGPVGDYHSSIAFWCWQHGLTRRHTAGMFRAEVFEALGYFDAWTGSERALAEAFAGSAVDVRSYLQGARRSGVFMHTVNHPRMAAVAMVARQVLPVIDPALPPLDSDILRFVDDPLSHLVWPVYPEIGRYLGVEGAYRWRHQHTRHKSLAEFIDASWEAYRDLDADRVSMFGRDAEPFTILEELTPGPKR